MVNQSIVINRQNQDVWNRKKINRLKVVLVENGKTGKWLAEQVGKNEATVSRWCSNKMQPSLDMLVKIAGLLNVDPRQLINGGNND